MRIGNIIINSRIKNRYTRNNLFGIITGVSKAGNTIQVIELNSGSRYTWISRECKVIYN